MSNKRKLARMKVPLKPEQIAEVAKTIKGPVSRGQRRAMRGSAPVASDVQDHHKPHELNRNCGPMCNEVNE